MPTLPEDLDLDTLAADLSKMIDRYGYPLDVHAGHIRPHLEAFLTAVLATADADVTPDAMTWSPPADEPPAAPVVQHSRRPRMDYLAWHRSQTVDIGIKIGADGELEHYWSCPKCPAWAGPYESMAGEPGGCKRTGMDHVYREHDVPAARAAECRRAERAAYREDTRRSGRTPC